MKHTGILDLTLQLNVREILKANAPNLKVTHYRTQ